jgi:hypothetical protein
MRLLEYKTHIIVLVVVAVAIGLYFYMQNKNAEMYWDMGEGIDNVKQDYSDPSLNVADFKPTETPKNLQQGEIAPEDLLPDYSTADDFSKENPVTKLLREQNFIVSGYHYGMNTNLQSSKIPYHDIRSLPVIPKEPVGPWNQSSYDETSGQTRRSFQIGSV